MPRIRCPSCGTEQEPPESPESGFCIGCGRSLSGGAGRTEAALPSSSGAAVFDLPEPDTEAAAAPLPGEEAARRPVEVDEILAAERFLTTLLALVPLWGAWRIWKSPVHGPVSKTLLTVISLGIALAIGVGIYEMIPDERARTELAHRHVEQELETLAGLVRRYRSEYGRWPDADTWAESGDRQDRRFYDPWGRAYLYELREEGFALGTLGRDGVRGGEGADSDIFRQFAPVK